MATWSSWFMTARELGFPLENYLSVNQPEDFERLRSSGLPFYEQITIDGNKFESQLKLIKDFCSSHPLIWVRVYRKGNPSERYYDLNLTLPKLVEYVKGLNVSLSQFNIQVMEYVHNSFGGNILSDGNIVAIEILQGKQEHVSRATLPFFHGQVGMTGALNFFENDAPLLIRAAAKRVLRQLKISRSEFIQGYFEFAISPDGVVKFFDYKTGFKK